MGKFRSKLKGKLKGKRWPKGQSSSSNPETRKYRDQAKSRFFQENLGPSNLTSDALRKHDAVTTYKSTAVPSEMDADVESLGTTFRTLRTFASDWSECSNVSFSRFMQVFRPDSAIHKEMLAVLAAVTEVIKQNNGTESSTEYYAALMTTLEATESEESLTAVLSLLSMGIKSVPDSVLRLQFSMASKVFVDLLNKNVNSDNNIVMKSIISCLSHILRVQELAVWNDQYTLHIFGAILACTCHTKPKVRKAAQHGVCSVLKGSLFMLEDTDKVPANHPAASYVAQFCVKQIEDSTGTAGQTATLHTLTLLKDVMHTFPKNHMKTTCETILKIMTLNNPLVTSCGMQALHSLFSAQSVIMPATLNGQLISALYDYQPSPSDTQPTIAWIAVMQQAHVHLADSDVAVSCATLPRIVKTLTQLWMSERPEVMNAVTRALQVILEDCVGPACADSMQPHLQKCFTIIEQCLGYQYNKAWHQVLYVIAAMFKVAGLHCGALLLGCLKAMADLRDSYKFSYNNELEHAVGAAVKSMGPAAVLDVISLKKNETEMNIDRSWLLPVLKENVQHSTLEYFVKSILPLSLMCQKKSASLASTNDGIGAHSYELLYIQLWNLLPSFCNNPTDIKTNFKSIAKVLGTAIADRKELRLAVMASLRKLISLSKENENEDDVKEIARFAKNYLPILFNLYTTKSVGTDEEGQRLAALDTIKVYLTICSPEVPVQLFTHALEKTKSEDDDAFVKESILDLIRVLAPYQDLNGIQTLYEQYIKTLGDCKNGKEQKKAYRLLEEICASDSEGCKQFVAENRKAVQKLLLKALSSTAVSSKGARLRCLIFLVKAQPQLAHDSKLLRSAIPEAVLCCKDINEKCRQAAYALLTTIGETLLKHNQMTEYITLLLAGLAATPQMMAATVLALASVTHNFSGSLGAENVQLIIETVCQLMTTSTREIVITCLSFVKVYLSSLPSPMIAASLPLLVKALASMTEDCKRHFRLKVRDILDRLMRKYGCDSIAPHIPASDTIMHKRLRNLRKLSARKKKQKEARNDEEEGDSVAEEFTVKAKARSVEDILADSDSDLDGMDVDEAPVNKRKVNTWIKEDADDIVDLMDPSTISKITTTKPGKVPLPTAAPNKPKDHGFKTASDGRLIIADDSDSDGEKPKKNLLKFNSDSESDDEDRKSSAETAIMLSKKRKRTDVESVRTGLSSQPAMKYKAGGSGIHRPLKSGDSVRSGAGSEYRSAKAKGDVKKKGKVDPYAYLPLSRSALNKRKRLKNSGQYKNIVRAAKSGAAKGMKAGKKAKR